MLKRLEALFLFLLKKNKMTSFDEILEGILGLYTVTSGFAFLGGFPTPLPKIGFCENEMYLRFFWPSFGTFSEIETFVPFIDSCLNFKNEASLGVGFCYTLSANVQIEASLKSKGLCFAFRLSF